ncbi:unnamed protein product [Hapterophycus canaliculatus]
MRTESECRYSKRRWHHRDPAQHRHQRQPKQIDGDSVHSRGDPAHLTPGGSLEHCMLPFKRCRFRASPATGLVGMQENAFLSDFFGCVGFLTLTDESQIRETMVKIMVSAAPQRDADFGADCRGDEGQSGALELGGTFSNASGVKQVSKDPSSCTFWCAVAVGALAKGSPTESVERYSKLAREGLVTSRPGSTDTDLAKASASLACLHSFVGDTEKFHESLELSESFLRASRDQESSDLHAEIPDLILRCNLVGSGSMHSPGAHEEAPPQLNGVVSEGDLYRFVMQSFRAFDQAVSTKARRRYAGDLDQFHSVGPSSQSCGVSDLQPWEVSEAIAEVLGTGGPLEFESLRETVDRPLVLKMAAKGDLHATLERLGRSVEVYERYPGLCRCVIG